MKYYVFGSSNLPSGNDGQTVCAYEDNAVPDVARRCGKEITEEQYNKLFLHLYVTSVKRGLIQEVFGRLPRQE